MKPLFLIKYLLGSVSYDIRNALGRGTRAESSIWFGESTLKISRRKEKRSGIKLMRGRALMRSGLVRAEEERERVGFGNMERKKSLLPRGRGQQRGNPGERIEAATSFQFRCCVSTFSLPPTPFLKQHPIFPFFPSCCSTTIG